MTAKVSFRTIHQDCSRPRRPRFSFFSIQLSNNRRSIPSQSHQNCKNHPNQIRLNSHQLHQETLERARRPPEAPPLSFDERRYRPNILNRQQPCDTFLKKSSKKCVWLSFTMSESRISGHFRPQTAQTGLIALRFSQSAPLERSIEPV